MSTHGPAEKPTPQTTNRLTLAPNHGPADKPTPPPAEKSTPEPNPWPAENPCGIFNASMNCTDLLKHDTSKHSDVSFKSAIHCDPVGHSQAEKRVSLLHPCSLLHELGVEQVLPTVTCEDNNGAAQLMTNAQHHTRRTRHVDLKQLAVLGTAHNSSDSLTKPTARLTDPTQPITSKHSFFDACDSLDVCDCFTFDLDAVTSMGR